MHRHGGLKMTDPQLLLNDDADIYEIRITNGTINLIFGDKAVAIGAIFTLYKDKLSTGELFDPWEKICDVNLYEHVQIWDGIENYTYPHILGFLEDNA